MPKGQQRPEPVSPYLYDTPICKRLTTRLLPHNLLCASELEYTYNTPDGFGLQYILTEPSSLWCTFIELKGAWWMVKRLSACRGLREWVDKKPLGRSSLCVASSIIRLSLQPSIHPAIQEMLGNHILDRGMVVSERNNLQCWKITP